ncbi:MAG: hypothetical protein ACYC2O_04960 [Microthrixaceae bacterium]
MATVLLLSSAVLLFALGLFLGVAWGFRTGLRDGQSAARMATREHWVDLLETSISESRSRAAHPSRGDAAIAHLTGRQET